LGLACSSDTTPNDVTVDSTTTTSTTVAGTTTTIPTCTITFDANGETGTIAKQTFDILRRKING